MANNNLDISLFNAVGAYVVEIDASTEPIQLDTQRTRIIPGFSRVGPKNTMVYLKNKAESIKVYGDIDPYLERRGSFFHRSLQTALETGPVFALNLVPINNDLVDGDKAEFISYSLDANSSNAYKNEQGVVLNSMYASFFNKERFWKPDQEYLQAIVDGKVISQGKYFSIVNLGNKPVSILTRKAKSVPRDFNMTITEYYGSGEEPAIANTFDYVSDYFIDVILISGEWNDYEKLSKDPNYNSFFDLNGLKKNRLDAFLSSDFVNVIGKYTGSVLPDMLDNQDTNHSIDVVMNVNYVRTGIYCTLNEKAIEEYDTELNPQYIDLIGHNLVNGDINKVDYLSYNSVIDALEVIEQETIDFEENINEVRFSPTSEIGFTINSNIENISKNGEVIFKNVTYDDVTLSIAEVNESNDKAYLHFGENNWFYETSRTSTNVNGFITFNNTNKLFLDSVERIKETAFKADKLEDGKYEIEFYLNGEGENSLESINGQVYNREWISEIANFGITYNPVLYILEGKEFKKLDYDTINGSVDVELVEITVEGLRIEGDSGNLIDSDTIYFAINPFTIEDGNITLHRRRKTAKVISDTNNMLLIGKYNEHYNDIDNLTSNLSWDNIIKENVTNDTYLINDNNTVNNKAYKLIKEIAEDDSILLYDTLKDSESKPLTFVNNEIKIDLVDAKTIYEEIEIERLGSESNTIFVSKEVGESLFTYDYLVGLFENEEVLTMITKKEKYIDDEDGTIEYEISTVLPLVVNDSKVTKYKKIDDFVTHFNLHKLRGFSYNKYHLPDGTDRQMYNIYSMLDGNLTNILKDKNIIDWRYVVDTFSGGVAPNMGGKVWLSKLAEAKGQALAILNAPSMADFAKSTNPYFTNQPTVLEPKPIINTAFIKDGGNLELGPSNKFSIPDAENGGKHSGTFGPYLVITENSKRKIIPPAADVSNNFIRKFKAGQPYAIVAGEPYGIINNPKMIGVEYELLDSDRANFEAIGINPIVSRDGVIKIFANLTGYQRVVSPLNSLHVRDLLISVENTILNITSKYLFRKNTSTVRLEIQTIVETYLEGLITDGAITEFNVIMDSSNNTDEIINQRIALLDVEITPALGMEKFVNRITIYGAGGSSASGFNS